MYKRQYVSVLNVQEETDSDHNLVAPEVAERLSVCKQIIQNFDIQRFTLKKMNDVEVMGQY
jgi:hypothetical protein